MLAHAALPLAFDHALKPERDPGANRGLGRERLGEIEVAGDLQRRHLPGFRCPCLLVFEEGRYFLPKPVHAGNPVSVDQRTIGAREAAWRKSPVVFAPRRKSRSEIRGL